MQFRRCDASDRAAPVAASSLNFAQLPRFASSLAILPFASIKPPRRFRSRRFFSNRSTFVASVRTRRRRALDLFATSTLLSPDRPARRNFAAVRDFASATFAAWANAPPLRLAQLPRFTSSIGIPPSRRCRPGRSAFVASPERAGVERSTFFGTSALLTPGSPPRRNLAAVRDFASATFAVLAAVRDFALATFAVLPAVCDFASATFAVLINAPSLNFAQLPRFASSLAIPPSRRCRAGRSAFVASSNAPASSGRPSSERRRC